MMRQVSAVFRSVYVIPKALNFSPAVVTQMPVPVMTLKSLLNRRSCSLENSVRA